MKKEFESQFPIVAEAQAHIGLDLEKNQNISTGKSSSNSNWI